MDLHGYLANQAIRFIEGDNKTREKQSPVPFIKGFEERYGFVQIPRTVAEIDLKVGVNFLRGFFKGKVIDKLSIYENGVLCEAEY